MPRTPKHSAPFKSQCGNEVHGSLCTSSTPQTPCCIWWALCVYWIISMKIYFWGICFDFQNLGPRQTNSLFSSTRHSNVFCLHLLHSVALVMSHHIILAVCFANTREVIHTAQSLLVLALVFPVFHYRQSSGGRRRGLISSISHASSNGKIRGCFVSLKFGQEKYQHFVFFLLSFQTQRYC